MPEDAFAYTARFNPVDLNVVFTGDSDGWLRAWSVEGGAELNSYQHSRAWYINSITVSPDGAIAAGGTGDADVILWQWEGAEAETEVVFSDDHGVDAVSEMAFAPDGHSLVVAARKSTVLWRDAEGDGYWSEQGSLTHSDWATGSGILARGRFLRLCQPRRHRTGGGHANRGAAG